VLGYVDDVVVLTPSQSDYYQLKNVASISWTAGDHPLETDFLNQYKLSQVLGQRQPLTHLVVPDTELKAKLEAAIPQAISGHTSVVHFPYADGSLNRLVMECAHLQELLKTLSRRREPTLDEIEGVYGVLMMSLEGCQTFFVRST
jgi:hypothetical protein